MNNQNNKVEKNRNHEPAYNSTGTTYKNITTSPIQTNSQTKSRTKRNQKK